MWWINDRTCRRARSFADFRPRSPKRHVQLSDGDSPEGLQTVFDMTRDSEFDFCSATIRRGATKNYLYDLLVRMRHVLNESRDLETNEILLSARPLFVVTMAPGNRAFGNIWNARSSFWDATCCCWIYYHRSWFGLTEMVCHFDWTNKRYLSNR